MELYEQLIHIIDVNLMFSLVPCILVLMLIDFVFKNKAKAKAALNIIRWFVIGYSLVTVTVYLFGMILRPEEYAFVNRATGPYWFAYWLMLFCAVILPFTLFIKKLASKYLYVLLVMILMKSGSYFERFVIMVTSIHRDYLPSDYKHSEWNSLWLFLGMIFLQGTILAIILLAIVEIKERFKTALEKKA